MSDQFRSVDDDDDNNDDVDDDNDDDDNDDDDMAKNYNRQIANRPCDQPSPLLSMCSSMRDGSSLI